LHFVSFLEDGAVSTFNEYSEQSQLPSMYESHYLRPRPESVPCRGDKGKPVKG